MATESSEQKSSGKSSDKKVRKLRPSPVTVRERASGAGERPVRPSRVRPVLSRVGSWAVWKPFKAVGRFLLRFLVPGYFKNSFRELRLVTWPDRRTTRRLTVAVIIFSIVFGLLVALVDYVLDKVFKKVILNI